MANSKARSSQSKATPRRKAPAAAAVVEEAPKGGLETGIAILTALILVTAIVLVDYELGKSYGEGKLFSDKYAQAK
jgi:uncharacterized protein HemX